MALTVLIAYDIQDNQRRAKTAATLQRCGDRIQFSVFLCTLTESELDQLQTKLAENIDADTDSLLTVRICATCWDSKQVTGPKQPPEPVLYWAAL